MNSFSVARKNMVDCQIQVMGVADQAVLSAFEHTPREAFAPKSMQDVAYLSENLPLGRNRFILEASVHARMVEALALSSRDVVLSLDTSGGYGPAILSPLVSTVISVIATKPALDKACAVWDDVEISNIAAFKGDLAKGWAEEAPYDSIVLGGAVADVPNNLVDQLALGGKMVFIKQARDAAMGQAMLLLRDLEGKGYSTTPLFEASAPYLPGFEPADKFCF